MTGEKPMSEKEMTGEQSEVKIVDKRAVSMEDVEEKVEREKGIDAMKTVFGFTNEDIEAIEKVLPQGELEILALRALKAREKFGEQAGILAKVLALEAKLKAVTGSTFQTRDGIEIRTRLGNMENKRKTGVGQNNNAIKELLDEGRTVGDILREDYDNARYW